MITQAVEQFNMRKTNLREALSGKHVTDYEELVKMVVAHLSCAALPLDPTRVHEINDGEYQGILLFVIGATGRQPSDYWYVKVSYGSCSGCDTLRSISGYSGAPPTKQQLDDYMTLALHIVQGLKKMDGELV